MVLAIFGHSIKIPVINVIITQHVLWIDFCLAQCACMCVCARACLLSLAHRLVVMCGLTANCVFLSLTHTRARVGVVEYWQQPTPGSDSLGRSQPPAVQQAPRLGLAPSQAVQSDEDPRESGGGV